MRIEVTKLTDISLARRACAFTTGNESSSIEMGRLYRCEHSPMRTQLFWIEMHDIPTFVSVHFVRHKVGVEHYVKSNRADRGGDAMANRWTPVDHAMLCNAQALINMARRRMCHKASDETQAVMQLIKDNVPDAALAGCLVPECIYRGNVCHELKPCGLMPGVMVAA